LLAGHPSRISGLKDVDIHAENQNIDAVITRTEISIPLREDSKRVFEFADRVSDEWIDVRHIKFGVDAVAPELLK
jgi:hypothetical protein